MLNKDVTHIWCNFKTFFFLAGFGQKEPDPDPKSCRTDLHFLIICVKAGLIIKIIKGVQ